MNNTKKRNSHVGDLFASVSHETFSNIASRKDGVLRYYDLPYSDFGITAGTLRVAIVQINGELLIDVGIWVFAAGALRLTDNRVVIKLDAFDSVIKLAGQCLIDLNSANTLKEALK